MTTARDIDTVLATWMVDAAGQPATRDRMERLAVAIQRRPPRATWLARFHDRWTTGPGLTRGGRTLIGPLAIAGVTILALAGVVGQLMPGDPNDRNGIGLAVPSPSLADGRMPVEIGALCDSDAPLTLPSGPLPETTRPTDAPMNDGLLAVAVPSDLVGGSPTLLDPTTGHQRVIAITSDGTRLGGSLFIIPGWSPDGRWLALRWGGEDPTCGGELIVSPDATRVINVTGYPPSRGVVDAAWSPDGRWLAVDSGDRIDVFGIGPNGSVGDARTVWRAPNRPTIAFGQAWGPDGTLAFQLEGQDDGAIVALLPAGATTPQLVRVPADVLGPLAWTSDGTAVIARGDVGTTDVGLFRITAEGADRIPLDGLHLHGGKWLDIPETIVGDRIVFAAYPDANVPEVQYVYSIKPDGSGLTRLTDTFFSVSPAVTFAAAPDGHRVAVSAGGTWILDLADGSRREAAAQDGGIMDWQPVP